MRQKIKAGSSFLFFWIRLLNFIYGLAGMILFGLAIWLWVELGTFSIVEIVFIFLGVFQMFLVILACTAKRSTGRLRCFLFLMGILFIIELVAVILVLALGDSIIDEVVDKAQAEQQYNKLKGYLNIVNYFVIGTLVVEFFLISFVYCYIGSLRNRNNEYDYKMVDNEGHKISLDEKQHRDKMAIQEKYARKREEMQQKYPNYKPQK